MITTAAELDTTLEAQTATFKGKTDQIKSYNYKQGVYCRHVLTKSGNAHGFSGIPWKKPTRNTVNWNWTDHKNKKDCVLLNNFQVNENCLFGQFEDDDNWYLLYGRKMKIMVRVETEEELQVPKGTNEEVFKKAFRKAIERETKDKEYEKLKTNLVEAEKEKPELLELQKQLTALQTQLANQETNYEKLQTKLTKKEEVCKKLQDTSKYYWYAVIILGISVLVLIVMQISTSTSPDSNTNRKFNIGDRVKVRNTKHQEWRTGVVKQSLKVEVDGWKKAHTWHYVQHIEPVSENTKSHSEETPKSNDLSKNMTEKETNDSSNSKKQLVTNSSSNAEQNKSDSKTASDFIDEVTEDTITPSEDNTENEENASVNTINNTTDTNTNSNSVQTTKNTNSS